VRIGSLVLAVGCWILLGVVGFLGVGVMIGETSVCDVCEFKTRG